MMVIETPADLKSFIDVPKDCDFPIQNLPYGVFSDSLNTNPRCGVAIGDFILDLACIAEAGLFKTIHEDALSWFNKPYLNDFMAQSSLLWQKVRERLIELLDINCATLRDHSTLKQLAFIPQHSATMHLPFDCRNYTDFYAGIHHAEHVGRLFRDKDNPLLPNYKHIPVAYHGRASSLVCSGTDIVRPKGQFLSADKITPEWGATKRLDFELEMGTVIGTGNALGHPITIDNALAHIFGWVLVNDWSARDIQQWEYAPLGPFLGKSFATTVSPWVVTSAALIPFAKKAPQQSPQPLPYLRLNNDIVYDIHLEVSLLTPDYPHPQVIAQTNMQELYWTTAQQITHHTVNGCNLQTGDLLASGTISGKETGSFGSLLEITEGGVKALELALGEQRYFLQDGDNIVLKAWCEKSGYPRIGFGQASGKVIPSL